MAKEIRISKLISELSEKLTKVHNLQSVVVGKTNQKSFENANDFVKPGTKVPIAYGEPNIIEEGITKIIDSFSNKNQIEVLRSKIDDAQGNALYAIFNIDTREDYSTDDLDDDDLFSEPYTLVK